MTYYNISKYLQAKQSWEQQHTVIENGKVNGISVKEFYQMNPKPRFEYPLDSNNPDKTNIPHGCKTRRK